MAVALGDLDDAARRFDVEGRLPDDDGKPLSDDAQTREFNCAFFYAAICGSVQGLKYALPHIAGINMQPPGSDFGGVSATPLHWAAGNGRADAVKWMMENEADPKIRDDIWDATPVGWAVNSEHKNVLDVFSGFAEELDPADLEHLS